MAEKAIAFGGWLPFDDSGPWPSERLLYFGTGGKANSHNSANPAVGSDSAEWLVSRRLPTLRRHANCNRVEC